MELKKVGSDFEAKCVGCGEILLLGEGEEINFRAGSKELDGFGIPMFEGFLCGVCNKRENGGIQFSVTFRKAECSRCGRETESGEPDVDENGILRGVICPECQ
jgi:hypothetical protein